MLRPNLELVASNKSQQTEYIYNFMEILTHRNLDIVTLPKFSRKMLAVTWFCSVSARPSAGGVPDTPDATEATRTNYETTPGTKSSNDMKETAEYNV